MTRDIYLSLEHSYPCPIIYVGIISPSQAKRPRNRTAHLERDYVPKGIGVIVKLCLTQFSVTSLTPQGGLHSRRAALHGRKLTCRF